MVDTNVAPATKNVTGDIERADTAVVVVSEIFKAAGKKSGPQLTAAMAPIYRVAVALTQANELEGFLTSRGIKPHFNVKNPCASILLAFSSKSHPACRSAFCKRASVLALALHQAVDPEQFPDWQGQWPLEKACVEWRNVCKSLRSSPSEEVSVLVDVNLEPDQVPLVGPTPLTMGHIGRRLGVLDFPAPDGKCRILASIKTSHRQSPRHSAPIALWCPSPPSCRSKR
jgi:hypothetical protein